MATKKTEVIEIKPIEITKVNLRVVGDTSLIMHAWDEKAKIMIVKPGTIKPKKQRNPVEEFINSMYWLTEKPDIDDDMNEEECEKLFCEAIKKGARFGFPATAFIQAAISAAYRMGWSKDKVSLRGAFFIEADDNGLIEIKSDVPEMREDMVKIGMGTASVRYRGEFKNWCADLTILYNKNGNCSIGDIINIINAGGYVCGVGEWRPERDGQYGMYHVQAN